MGLRDDLIAAKALIDTPEKWREVGTVTGALNDAMRFDDNAFIAARAFLRDLHGYLLTSDSFRSHAAVMALFDRAIAAADPSPQLIDAVRKEG